MKTLVIFLVTAFAAATVNAQELIELKEARVNYTPLISNITNNGNTFSYSVMETFRGEFEKDPLAFVQKHFDIQQFMEEVMDKNYSSYEVYFKSRKGSLFAEFDKNGKLVFSSQNFKNIVLPYNIYQQLYLDHKGWSMINNAHVVRSKNGKLKHNYYKITMQNGNKKLNLKINATAPGTNSMVSN